MSTEKYTPSLDEMVFFEDELHSKNMELDTDSDPTADSGEIEQQEEETIESNNAPITNADTNDSAEEDPSDLTPYTEQYNYLKELGLILVDEDFQFDGSADSLQEAVEKTKQNMEIAGATSIWNKLPDDFKVVLEYALSGGTDIKKVQSLLVKDIDYDKVDIEDEVEQERIVRQHLKKTTQFDDKKIDNYIRKLRAANGLEEEAESALHDLKQLDAQERQRLVQEQQQAEQERIQRLTQSYNEYAQVVDRLEGIDKRRKEQLIQAVWKPGKYGQYENVTAFNYIHHLATSNPEHLAQLTQIYLSYDPEKGFVNNQLLKQAESKAKAGIRDVFDKFNSTNSGKSKVTDKSSLPNKNTKSNEANKLEAWLQQTINK